MIFTRAITRRPCRNMVKGLTTAKMGSPDYELALKQHQQYIEALEACGLEVTVLAADERYPDSVFVEDPAVLTPHGAVITNPAAPSRKGETGGIRQVLAPSYDQDSIEHIAAPGTLEGGDVLQAGDHYYIGLSKRTNEAGARQMADILQRYGREASLIPVENMLHLKTGLSYLERQQLLAVQDVADRPEFDHFDILEVEPEEAYAANSVWINGTVLVPAGYPRTKTMIEEAGYNTIALDVSEFRKLDGGLSCLSLRF